MTPFDAFLARMAGALHRCAPIFGAALVALSVGAAFYVKDNLGVNTSGADMFSPELPFRQERDRLAEQFPMLDKTLVAVVRASTPETAEAAALELVSRLQEEPSIESAYYALQDGFFDRHGLLYKDLGELEEYANTLAEAQPFLSQLMEDPSLRGLFDLLARALESEDLPETETLDALMEQIDRAVRASIAGQPYQVSWRRLMFGETAEEDGIELVFANPRLDYSKLLPAKPSIEALDRIGGSLESVKAGLAEILVTGKLAMEFEEMQNARDGALRAAGLALVFVSGLLTLCLRSGRLIAASLASLVCGLSITAGLAALLVGQLNLISLAFAVLYIGLSVDYSIHFCLYYREARSKGAPPQPALQSAVKNVGPALFLASLTTAAGFYAFLLTDFDGVSELGLIAGSGMLVSVLASLTLLPAVLRLFPLERKQARREIAPAAFVDRFVGLPERRAGAVCAFSIGAAALAALFAPGIAFDTDPMNLRNEESESVRAMRLLADRELASPWTIEVLADSADEAEALADELQAVEGVGRTVSLLDFIPSQQDEKLLRIQDLEFILGGTLFLPGKTPPPPSLAEQKAAIANLARALPGADRAEANEIRAGLKRRLQAFLAILEERPPSAQETVLERLERAALGSFPAAMEKLRLALQAEPVEMGDLSPLLRQRWLSPDGVYRVQAFPEPGIDSQEELRALASRASERAAEATGDLIVTVESGKVVTRSFRNAFLYAFVAVTAILLLHTRSPRDAGLILVPLLFASALTVACVVALGIPFNFANVIALPLLLGFGVDNGIHMVHRFRRLDAGERLLESSAARGVFYSSLTTVFSFGNLALSPHPGTASMGLVLTIGVLMTLLATLVALPAFLARFGGRRQAGAE